MKAVIYTKYGPPEVMQIKEVKKPIPRNDEVCIKIKATAVTDSDIFVRGSKISIQYWIPMRLMLGFFKPRQPILGEVLAGEIESVGKDVSRFKPGDQVYGLTGFGFGGYAEYKCMKATDSTYGCLGIKPTNITFEEATAAGYGGLLALQQMEKGNIKSGQKVLIYGASSTTGTTAVQIAKYMGAEVTGICSTKNLEFVKALGADKVIDYTKVNSFKPGEHYDFILDAVGKRRTSELKRACRKALNPGGIYTSIDDGKLELKSERLAFLNQMIIAWYFKPVLDRNYLLEQIVEATRYVEQGHKRGGVAITV